MSNNIDLVEIKLYEDKMNIVNFPHLIKGESHVINFSISRLVKNYGENSAQVGIDWNIVKPTSSVLLIKSSTLVNLDICLIIYSPISIEYLLNDLNKSSFLTKSIEIIPYTTSAFSSLSKSSESK